MKRLSKGHYKNLYFLLLFFFFYSFVYSQNDNLEKGYLILNEGDTLHGYIKQTNPVDRSVQIIFIQKDKKEEIKYTPDQVRKYFFGTSNYFVSDSVLFRNNYNKIYFKKLFLQKLLDGPLELYRLDHSVSKEQAPFYQYETTFFFFKEKGNNPMIDLLEGEYRIKLKRAFKSKRCKLGKKKNYSYTNEGLANLIEAYNTCLGGPSFRMFEDKSKPQKSASKKYKDDFNQID